MKGPAFFTFRIRNVPRGAGPHPAFQSAGRFNNKRSLLGIKKKKIFVLTEVSYIHTQSELGKNKIIMEITKITGQPDALGCLYIGIRAHPARWRELERETKGASKS